jgi:O-antigen/teichoic acid export membrane protein
MIDKIWLGHNLSLILLAFVASFFQQQVWQTIVFVGEASRKTLTVQLLGLCVVTFNFVVILVLLSQELVSLTSVLWLYAIEYAIAALFAPLFLSRSTGVPAESPSSGFRDIFHDYAAYCRPLVLFSLVNFLYVFSDQWILQRFAGSQQQGFYQISSQFANVGLLATTSLVNIFWKEIAEAHERGQNDRVRLIFRKVIRSLVMFGACVSGLIIPWSPEIARHVLGEAYVPAWPVLAIMLLHPIYQCVGQINGTMLLATGRTRVYAVFGIIFMLTSVPVTYFILAPAAMPIPGLGLGAVGMALKMVVLNILAVNVLAILTAHAHKLKFEGVHQLVGTGIAIMLGYLSKSLIRLFPVMPHETGFSGLFLPILMSLALYGPAMLVLIWSVPSLVGMDREELKSMLKRHIQICRMLPSHS